MKLILLKSMYVFILIGIIYIIFIFPADLVIYRIFPIFYSALRYFLGKKLKNLESRDRLKEFKQYKNSEGYKMIENIREIRKTRELIILLSERREFLEALYKAYKVEILVSENFITEHTDNPTESQQIKQKVWTIKKLCRKKKNTKKKIINASFKKNHLEKKLHILLVNLEKRK